MFLFFEMSATLQCLMPPYMGIAVLLTATCIFNTHNIVIDLSDYISVL